MTIPSNYVISTTGNLIGEPVRVGGAAIGITSATTTTAGSPITRTFTLAEQGIDGVDRFSAVKDVAHTVEALANTGTFAYNQVAYMFRGNQSSNTINGTASTLLSIGGNEQYRDKEHSTLTPIGAKTLVAWGSGNFNYLPVSGQRHNWTTIPGSLSTSFDDNFGSATTVDDAIGTRSVPGELTYQQSSIPNTGQYDAQTG